MSAPSTERAERDATDREAFDRVVVITDRLVLDRHLQETIKYEPFHHSSMRQAIEEGFIHDVLANDVTDHAELDKAITDDPSLGKSQSA